MELTDKKGRRMVIEEITKRWIQKNPEIFKTFGEQVKEMRQGKPYENQAHFYKATIPGDLFRQLEFALDSGGEPRLFDEKGELDWFGGLFPEFIIKYDATESVR